MNCPKCGADQADANEICEECGIVFTKYYKYHPRAGEESAQSFHPVPEAVEESGSRSLLFPARPKADGFSLVARGVLLGVLMLWGLSLMLSSVESNAAGESFFHLINLPFHEFGHILFRPFGSFLGSLGGTLGQLLMPAICLWVLLVKTRDPFGAAVALWWFGENFLDIAPYIDDARAGQLPLLGGNYGHSSPYGFHDWEYILTESGLLHMDHSLAQFSHILGSLIMILAMTWGVALLYGQFGALNRRP
jgi:hypothetical protein